MAKSVTKDGGGDDDFQKMDDASLACLEQVRKGKSLNFVLSMKGGDVRSLVVKKTPLKDKDRAEARGGGYQPVFGVATGSGSAIKFIVSRADGFDEKTAASRTDKLKKFLKDQTGKPLNPTIELVETLPPIPFDDDDLKDPLIARFMQLQYQIDEACTRFPESVPQIQSSVNSIRLLLQDVEKRPEASGPIDELATYLKNLLGGGGTAPPPTPSPPPRTEAPPDGAEAAFKARVNGLLPKVKAAAGTPAGEGAKLKVSEAAVLARKQAWPEANKLLDEAESLLTGATPPGGTPPGKLDGVAAKLAESLQKLQPLIDQVSAAQPARKGELLATAAQITAEINQGQLDQAKQNIMSFATLLKSLVGQSPSPPPGGANDLESQVAALRQTLEPRLLEAQRLDREKATKLGAVWDYVGQQVSTGNFRNALSALERLQTALAEVIKAAPSTDAERYSIPTGIVEERRRALEDFFSQQIASSRAETELKVRDLETPFSEVINESKELMDAVKEDLDTLYNDVQTRLTESLQSGAYEDVARSLDACRKEIEANELIAALTDAKSVLELDVGVALQFRELLDSFDAKLQELKT